MEKEMNDNNTSVGRSLEMSSENSSQLSEKVGSAVVLSRTGFVYIWYDRKNKMFYLGSHLGSVEDGYVGSGKRFLPAYNKRPADFKRRIAENNIPEENLLEREQHWLSLIEDEELGVKYYNLKKVAAGGDIYNNLPEREKALHRARCNFKIVEISKQYSIDILQSARCYRKLLQIKKQSKNKPGQTWMGRKHSQESREKMSVAAKRRGSCRVSFQHTEESKQKISANSKSSKAIQTPFGQYNVNVPSIGVS